MSDKLSKIFFKAWISTKNSLPNLPIFDNWPFQHVIKRYTCCFVVTVLSLSVRSYEHKKKIQILKRIPVWQGIMQFSVWHSHYVPSRHRCVVKESFLRSYMHDVRVTIQKLYDQYFVVIINCPFKPGYLVPG